jgi:hypothetical protein
MASISIKEASNLVRKGAFSTARAIRVSDDAWRLSLIPKFGELTYDLHKYRSSAARTFRTLDATASAAKSIGFSTVEVQL